MKELIRAATLATALAASVALMACGGGSDADSEAPPSERLPLGSAVLKLNAQPYRDDMPIAYTPGSTACLNLIVPVQMAAVEGLVPSGIVVRAVRLRKGNEDVWRALVADADRGFASGTARGCPTAATAPGTAVRVIAELDTPAGGRQLFTDAVIAQTN
jgi:hypothetical protein